MMDWTDVVKFSSQFIDL